MRLVVFSDTHGSHNELRVPDGDILIFAGDLCSNSRGVEILKFRDWFMMLPHKYKIIIAGNHDWPLYWDRELGYKEFMGIAVYLQDNSTEIEGVKIYGSPWQPEFNNWAFNLPRGAKLKKQWDRIPEDTNILITHGPPMTILDKVNGVSVGCEDLLNRVMEIKPKCHIFGHIHTDYGVRYVKNIRFINASIVNDYNKKTNECVLLDLN